MKTSGKDSIVLVIFNDNNLIKNNSHFLENCSKQVYDIC